jgi:hypothetical protein
VLAEEQAQILDALGTGGGGTVRRNVRELCRASGRMETCGRCHHWDFSFGRAEAE